MMLNERLTEVRQLWAALLPYCAMPTENTLIRWVARFNTEELMRGFSITGGKFDKERTAEPDRIYRYCTSVLHNNQLNALRTGVVR